MSGAPHRFVTGSPAADEVCAGWQPPALFLVLEQSGDSSSLREILSLFREDSLSRLRQLDEAVARMDLAVVRKHAHVLKGSALEMGADALIPRCRRISHAARQGAVADLPELVRQLRVEFDRIWPAMAARAGA